MLLWDARENLEKNHLAKLEEIKSKYKHKDDYYIHVCVNWTNPDMTELKNVYLIRDKKPPKMLGSMLYYINNKRGEQKLEWALPLDVLVDDSLLDLSTAKESTMQHLKGVEKSIQVS